jgi:hypothetical protein
MVEEHPHGLDLGRQEPADAVPSTARGDDDAGHAEGGEQRDPRVLLELVEEEEPIHAALPGPAPVDLEILAALADDAQKEGPVGLVEVLLDPEQRPHVVRLGHDHRGVAGDDQPDGPRPACRKRHSGRAGLESQLVGQFEDLAAGFRADAGAAVQRIRDRGLGDREPAGDVADRHPLAALGPVRAHLGSRVSAEIGRDRERSR